MTSRSFDPYDNSRETRESSSSSITAEADSYEKWVVCSHNFALFCGTNVSPNSLLLKLPYIN